MGAEHRITPLPPHGAHLIETRNGRSVVRLRSGRFAALDRQTDDASAHDEAPLSQQLSAELDARDAADAATRWPAERRNVCLVGTGEILDQLASALSSWGVNATRCDIESAPPSDAALVLAYADTPAERARWAQLDELPQQGVAWLRVHREGECVFVDPLAVTADDATSEQVHRRRIAASRLPDELVAWQRAADADATAMDAAALALTLAQVLRVMLAWAQDADCLPTLRRTLWKLVPATATITEHIVLGYPDTPSVTR